MTQPPHGGPAAVDGHPEPEPVPDPEPDPPQPIPPPEPAPAPEPPHATPDFIDAGPATAPIEWPPIGAYPGEPGHPEPQQPTELLTPVDGPPAWPPAPAQPWHARHERPGEWQTQPPEHLAWEHSPPPEYGPEHTDPIWAGHQPPPPGHPWQVPLAPAPAARRGGLWVSLALTVILLLCGGGAASAYFLVSNADTGKGAADPVTAVNRFLTAVYTQQDAAAAEQLVCRQARDKTKLTARIDQIKNYANEYDGPTFRWSDPAVKGQTDQRATVTTELTLATEDEKQAQQTLTFTTVHKTGWLVCDIAG